MSDYEWPDEDYDGVLGALIEQHPKIMAYQPFVRLASEVRWFAAVGEASTPAVERLAAQYAADLGFPEVYPVFLRDWREAADAYESLDINSTGWEAEEQLRAALATDMEAILGAELLSMLASGLGEKVTPVIEQAALDCAEFLRIDDEEFLRAAVGAGIQACHQAMMVAMSDEEGESHPFRSRFALFEAGRWPIAIIGGSFLVL